jgi:uncharacterized protein YceK
VRTRHSAAYRLWLLAWVTSGCGPAMKETEESNGTDTTAASTTSFGDDTQAGDSSTNSTPGDHTSSTGSTGSTSDSSSTGLELECEPRQWSACTVPVDCREPPGWHFECGRVSSYVDALGCPRWFCDPRFGPTGCPEGMRCHDPKEECDAKCGVDPMCTQDEDGGQCLCGGPGACIWIPMCVRADLYPEGYCDA